MRYGLHTLALVFVATAIIQAGTAQTSAPDKLTATDNPIAPQSARWTYVQPTEKTKFNTYLLEAFGPYPLGSTLFVSAYHQATRTPPDWREGFPGYGERFASDFGISAVNITTRYTLARALDEDTLYYRCACTGFWPRLRHAVVSTAIARRGADGHKVFALPAIAGPYAGNMAAVYGWFPRRYGAKDAFRMGNYGLLLYAGANISLEFLPGLIHSTGHSWMSRLHLENPHGAGNVEPTP